MNDTLTYLYNNGAYYHAYRTFGAHLIRQDGAEGIQFTVWAPDVVSVSVVGDFTGWDSPGIPLSPMASSGIWSGFVPGLGEFAKYKYRIQTADGRILLKADPFAFYAEKRPNTASLTCRLEYNWQDEDWMRQRQDFFQKPLNIYEVHPGSWKRQEDGSFLSYAQLAEELIPYVKDMGYTHIELLPLMEHPLDASWGYQVTGFFAATSRFGRPVELMQFIDCCHREGIGVILDWVPGHFCPDDHGLRDFNGTPLYGKLSHPHWGTLKFDFSSGGVRSFLLSSAMFWLEVYHADGLRVDGVTSMINLNFGIEEPEKKRYNIRGGEEDLDAVSFLQDFNRMIGIRCPGVFTVAEESSAWPLVTAPPDVGGLGFHYKWDMGWMNDTLRYMKTDFPYRPGCHSMLTFSMMYAFQENFILPLSHDEVVHGKCSLIGRMPGDYWRKFAGLRLLALYQITHPGGKLNFMGNEFGQFIEWRYQESLEWFLLQYEAHEKHRCFVRALNRFYLDHSALWASDHSWEGFQWLDPDNAGQCVFSYLRLSEEETLAVILNGEVNPIDDFRLGFPHAGQYTEVFNTDAAAFGGSGYRTSGIVETEPIPCQNKPCSISLTVPPLGGVVLRLIPSKEEPSQDVFQQRRI